MSRERVIDYIGGSEEERAQLRRILDALGPRLRSSWRWGTEEVADLLLVDPNALAGELARTRALESGVRCVVVTSRSDSPRSDFVLHRPIQSDELLRVLDSASAAGDAAASTGPAMADGTASAGDDWQELFAHLDLDGPAPQQPPGLEESGALFRRDPVEERSKTLLSTPLDMNATIDWSGDEDRRAADPTVSPRSGLRGQSSHLSVATPRRAAEDEEPEFRLLYFLSEGALGGPCRLVPEGLPPLVLDPKERVYHCAVALQAMEPYCRLHIRRGEWVPLTRADLTQVRSQHEGQPYDRLRWLDALLRSSGTLARHLDPGGVCRLRRWFRIASDYPRAYRISTAMLRPVRLHELAATTGLPMAEIFDVVNAWDAVGYLEWQPRDRLRNAVAAGR